MTILIIKDEETRRSRGGERKINSKKRMKLRIKNSNSRKNRQNLLKITYVYVMIYTENVEAALRYGR